MPDAVDKPPDIRGKYPPDPPDTVIAGLADTQHGVVAYRQLEALGLGARAIEHRIAVGRLHRIHKGVYAVGRRTLSRHGRWMAAVLACGPDAVLSHRSAAALWGLRQSAWKIEVTVPKDRRRAEIRVHRAKLRDDEITREDGIPVTTVARTLLDLAAVIDRGQLARAVEQADRLRAFDLRAVEAVLSHARRRSGTVALRDVLAEYREPADIRSELERRFVALLPRSRLPTPHVNVLVGGFVVDFLWPQSRLVVELDGRAYHTSPRAFERDRVRDAKLQRAGYRVMRITHRRLRDDPAGILEDIAALVA